MKLTLSYIIFLLVCTGSSAQITPRDSLRINHLENILEQAKSGSGEKVSEAYIELCVLYSTADYSKAAAVADSLEKFLMAHGQPELLPRVSSLRGLIYANGDRPLDALREYQLAIEGYEQRKIKNVHTAYLHVDIGNIFYKLSQYRDALDFYEKANTIFLTDNDDAHRTGRAVALNNMGLCHLEMLRYSVALNLFHEALDIRTELQIPELITHSYTHLVDAYLKSGELEKADSIISLAFGSAQLDHNSIWFGQLRIQHANLLIREAKLEEARAEIAEIDSFSFGTDQDFFNPVILQTKARFYLALNKYGTAKTIVDTGYTKALKKKNFRAAFAFGTIGKDISLQQGDSKGAFAYSENMLHIKDSMSRMTEGIISELLEINVAFARAQKKNRELQSTSDNYASTIKGQTWLLIGSFFIIAMLLVLFWYINKLSQKQKKNQQNQRELNQRILAVVNNTDSHILSLNSDGLVRLINQSAIEFFKSWMDIDIRAGENLFDKIKGREVQVLWHQWFEKSKHVSGWKEVAQIVIKGKTYYYLENFSAITRENGKYAGIVMVGNDITKEHEFSVELSQQRDVLEKSNKAKEKMLSILAHDLKDAVYSARSLAEMVTETPEQFPKDELVHLFSLLYNNFDKTKQLLDSLLEWMKTQTGAMEAHPEPVNLEELAIEVKSDCDAKATSKCIEILIDVEKGTIVSADREMIRTVMRNLVNNAIKYTRPEKGRVIIKAIIIKQKAEIHVRDNGTGISLENQQKLFNHTERLSIPGTENEQGTGFGLSLCKELLRLNNTSLQVESKESQGSDFYFCLPLVDKKQRVLRHTH